jgi:hypothetical protein
MAATLLLTIAYSGDLVAEAVLAEAIAAEAEGTPLADLPDMGRLQVAIPALRLFPAGADPAAQGVTRAIVTGRVPDANNLAALLARAAAVQAAGGQVALRNLSLESGAIGEARPELIAELRRLAGTSRIAARDHRTAEVLTRWRMQAPPRLLAYPEAGLAPDPALAQLLPAGEAPVGLSMRGSAEVRAIWRRLGDRLRAALAPLAGRPVLPLLPHQPWNGSKEDDAAGIRDFAQEFLPGSPLLLPEAMEHGWWRKQMTAARLKGLVARCGVVVTQRDLPAAFATACGVPVLGVWLHGDRRVADCLATLADRLAPGSSWIGR